MAIEHTTSSARAKVLSSMRAHGWSRRWLRPSHYDSPFASAWIERKFWHPSRYEAMVFLDESSALDGGGGGGGASTSPFFRPSSHLALRRPRRQLLPPSDSFSIIVHEAEDATTICRALQANLVRIAD